MINGTVSQYDTDMLKYAASQNTTSGIKVFSTCLILDLVLIFSKGATFFFKLDRSDVVNVCGPL